MTRSAERKQRRRALRQVERTRRSALTLLVLSGAALAVFLSCSFGVPGFWCVAEPFSLIVIIVLSALAGLALGGTIRTYRERRALERDDR